MKRLAAGLWLLLACLAPGESIDPAPEWRGWYQQVEACSGLTRDFDAIVWSVHDQPDQVPGGLLVGWIDFPDHIWIARDYLTRPILEHEMLHYLLGRKGHPSPPFCYCAFCNHAEP
jgi:hypothetical protein